MHGLRPGTQRRCLIAPAGAMASLIMLAGCGGNGSITSRSDIAVICSGDTVKAGTPVSSGSKICNDVTIGDLVLSADFAKTGTSDSLVEVYPSSNITNVHEAATFESGAAVLHSTGPEQEAVVAPNAWLQAAPPPEVLAVADFKGLSANSTLGISPRCTKDACILFAINGDGKYRIATRQGRSWNDPLTGDLNADTGYPAPRLDPTGENRLIVWLSHNTIVGILNGRLLGSLQLSPPAVNEAFLFYSGLKHNEPTQLSLLRVYFFVVGK